MMEIVNIVESKVKEIQDLITSHNSTISNITSSIERLVSNRSSLIAEIHKLEGAIQAFASTTDLIKSKISPSAVAEVVGTVVEAIIPEATPIVEAVQAAVAAETSTT